MHCSPTVCRTGIGKKFCLVSTLIIERPAVTSEHVVSTLNYLLAASLLWRHWRSKAQQQRQTQPSLNASCGRIILVSRSALKVQTHPRNKSRAEPPRPLARGQQAVQQENFKFFPRNMGGVLFQNHEVANELIKAHSYNNHAHAAH